MSDDTTSEALTDIATLSFEDAQHELESIVEQLENQATGLEDAVKLWERGEALHAHCQTKLDYAASRIEKLTVSAEESAAVSAEQPNEFTDSTVTEPVEPVEPVAPPAASASPAEPVAPPAGSAPQAMF